MRRHLVTLTLCAIATACTADRAGADFSKLDPRRGLEGGHLVSSDSFRGPLDTEQWRLGGEEADWRVNGGTLHSDGSLNQPIWLLKQLPAHARIEIELSSSATGGDFRFELFANGEDNESGYVAAYDAYGSTAHVLAKFDEHDTARAIAQPDAEVSADQVYRMTFVRTDPELRWFVDDGLLLSLVDSDPLRGAGHQFFGFNSWTSPVSIHQISVYEVAP